MLVDARALQGSSGTPHRILTARTLKINGTIFANRNCHQVARTLMGSMVEPGACDGLLRGSMVVEVEDMEWEEEQEVWHAQ